MLPTVWSSLSPCTCSAALLLLLAAVPFASGQEPPASLQGELPDMSLMLEPVINGRVGEKVIPIDYRSGHYYAQAADLADLGLTVDTSSEQSVAVDELKDVTVTYDGESQRLFINVPIDWLPEQRLTASGAEASSETATSENPLGLLFNYDVYASHSSNSNTSSTASAYTEQRLMGFFGTFSNSGVYNQRLSGGQSDSDRRRYLRYDTLWHYDDEKRMLKYVAGDAITDSLPWSSAIRFAGVQISRNFSVRPDLITYPLPQFAGQATVPSAVDVYLDSYKTSSVNVNPGPFTVETVPYINGAGDATVVVTDPLGRQVNATVPFYVSSALLKPGLIDFSLSAGKIRNAYGVENADYGNAIASGIIRAGATQWLTLEGRAESADGLSVGGLGGVVRVGTFGVINGAYSASRARDGAFSDSDDRAVPDTQPDNTDGETVSSRGHQRSLGYAYTQRYFSISAQQIDRSEGYGDLSNYKSGYQQDKRRRQISGSLSLQRFGSLGVGYFDITQHDQSRTRLMNLSYSTTLFGSSSLYASVNRELGASGYSAQVSVSIPLGDLGNASLSSSRDAKNRWNHQATYSKSAPIDGGLGWALSYAMQPDGNPDYRQASLDYAAKNFRLQSGVYGDRDETYWGEFSGSLVAVKGNVFTSRTINDSFALVSTNGYPDIPVRYENQTLGKTNQDGYLLIPTVSAYSVGKYEIEPLDLPADVQIPEVEQYRAVKSSGGTVIEFPLRKVVAVTLTLVDENRTPLPRGSLVRQEGQQDIAYIGWDGETYIGNATAETTLKISRADNGRQCQAHFNLPNPLPSGGWTPGKVICEESHHE